MAWKTRYGTGAVFTYRNVIDPMIYPLRPRIVRLCIELGVREILDIASGTGAQCRMLGQAGIQATGLDLAEAMIATARGLGGNHTDYVLGSATELPFDNDRFDACLLLLALHEHQENERTVMLDEALRVLRTDGHLILAEYQQPANRRSLHLPWQLIRFIEHAAGGEHRAGFLDFVARGSLSGFLQRHGLGAVREVRSHFGTIRIVAITALQERGALI